MFAPGSGLCLAEFVAADEVIFDGTGKHEMGEFEG
jgi:hypothetical protein